MDKKKILLVTRAFHPRQSPRAFRATELAKEFCRQGHDLTVLAPWHEDIEPLKNEYGFKLKELKDVTWRVPQFKEYNKIFYWINRAVVRALGLLLEYPAIQLVWNVRKALRGESGNDALISIAVPYPIHWGVASIWKKGGMNPANVWIADCGDPYMGQENDNFKPPFYFGWIEKWFCRKVDYLTVPVEGAKKGYYREFHEKIHVIPQGFNFEDFPKTIEPDIGSVPTGYFAGSLIPGFRDPGPLCEVLLTIDKPYKVVFYTTTPQWIKPYADRSGGKIELRNPIPREVLLKELAQAHFLVNIENGGGDAQLPSKLIEYAILGKPILSVGQEVDKELVKSFLNGDYSGSLKLMKIDQYRVENIVQKILTLVNDKNKSG